MKITLITACYNSAGTIRTAIESVLAQRGVDVEYIVVDGASTDGTQDIIKEYVDKTLNSQLITPNFTFRWLSERDRGMYDAINKGIKMATGDIIGILNADDVLATDDTLAHIAAQFEKHSCEILQSRSDLLCNVCRRRIVVLNRFALAFTHGFGNIHANSFLNIRSKHNGEHQGRPRGS